jgi:hypothetical protein
MREIAIERGIGRRVLEGCYMVSWVALQMALDGDRQALTAYRDHGIRADYEPVARYYRRLGLDHLLDGQEVPAAHSAQRSQLVEARKRGKTFKGAIQNTTHSI